MKNTAPMRGVIAVAATPFRDDNTIDLESVRKYVRHALGNGVVGFLIPAMAAEVETLTEVERKHLVETVLQEVNGRVPVIGGASSVNQKSRLRHAETLIGAGCDGVLVYIPFEDEKRYTTDIHEIAETGPGFLVLQDVDGSGYGIPVSVIAKLYEEIEVFNWMKVEVVDRCPKFTEIREAVGPGLQIATAGTQMIEALDRGVVAYMPTILHDIYGSVYCLHQQGDRDGARELFYKLLPIISFMNHHPSHGERFNKTVLFQQGIFKTTNVRKNPMGFDAFAQSIADELAEKAIQFCQSISHL